MRGGVMPGTKAHFGSDDDLMLHLLQRCMKMSAYTAEIIYDHRLKVLFPFFIPVPGQNHFFGNGYIRTGNQMIGLAFIKLIIRYIGRNKTYAFFKSFIAKVNQLSDQYFL